MSPADRPSKRKRARHRLPVRWSREAEDDLLEIAGYIAADTPDTARRTMSRIRARTNALTLFPMRGRIVPELLELGVSTWREVVVPPYRVMYTIEDERVEIDVVADGRRDFETLLVHRLLRGL